MKIFQQKKRKIKKERQKTAIRRAENSKITNKYFKWLIPHCSVEF